MLKHPDVKVCEGDMCQFCTQQIVNGEPLFIKQRTKFMTNAGHVGAEIGQRCKGLRRHVELHASGDVVIVPVREEHERAMEVNEVTNYPVDDRRELQWTRRDRGAARLVVPGNQ